VRRHHAEVFIFEIPRRIFLASESKRRLLVLKHGRRNKDRARPVGVGQRRSSNARIERSRIDERLEDRSGGPMRNRMVELALPVVAPAYQRQHLPGMRIERHHRYLRIDNMSVWLHVATFYLARVDPFHLCIDNLHADVHSSEAACCNCGSSEV